MKSFLEHMSGRRWWLLLGMLALLALAIAAPAWATPSAGPLRQTVPTAVPPTWTPEPGLTPTPVVGELTIGCNCNVPLPDVTPVPPVVAVGLSNRVVLTFTVQFGSSGTAALVPSESTQGRGLFAVVADALRARRVLAADVRMVVPLDARVSVVGEPVVSSGYTTVEPTALTWFPGDVSGTSSIRFVLGVSKDVLPGTSIPMQADVYCSQGGLVQVYDFVILVPSAVLPDTGE